MRKLKLTKALKQELKPALRGGEKASVYREIEQGNSHLVQTLDGNLVLILRFEAREMVVVAAVGANLRQSRKHIIDFAIANGMYSIRFHTRHPERLTKGLAGLPVRLVERRRRLGSDEYIYRLQVM